MEIDVLKAKIMEKAAEMVDCAGKIGKEKFFEINIKHVNGELVTKMEFSDKEKMINCKA